MKDTLRMIAGLLIGVVILALALAAGPRLIRVFEARDFEQSGWLASVGRDSMSDSVIDWLVSENPSREEVIQKLGPPSMEHVEAGPWTGHFSYMLDLDENVIDHHSVEVWFENGRAKAARRKQH